MGIIMPFEDIPKSNKGYSKVKKRCKGCGIVMQNVNLNRLYCNKCIRKGTKE